MPADQVLFFGRNKCDDLKICPPCFGILFVALAGSHSGHLTKTVVTGVTQHVGPTYYHHIHHSYGSYGDAADIHHSYGSYGDADEASDADAAEPSI